MCGIIGYVGDKDCTELLLEGLSRLEYRGYDSAGIAVVQDGNLALRRAEGKLVNLRGVVANEPVRGGTGIGHTRWATHGGPTERNAHPHRVGSVAVVHNGIIENFVELKRELSASGAVFSSETDTEVIAHLIAGYRAVGESLKDAVRFAVGRLEGAFAIVVVDADDPDRIVVARMASPMVVGVGEGENFVASDVTAVLGHTRQVMFLDEGSLAELSSEGVRVERLQDGALLRPDIQTIHWTPAMAEKGGYKHFMLKEIFEQPRAIADTLRGRYSLERLQVELADVSLTSEQLGSLSQCYIVACGTSWHAGLVGQYLFEDLAGIAPRVELASEFRYRNAPIDSNTLILAISQSGETADTLAAIRDAKQCGATVLSICNVVQSSIPRESHGTIYTHAGPEIGVASTKAFTTQLVCLHLLALHFGRLLGRLSDERMAEQLNDLLSVPAIMEEALRDITPYEGVARFMAEVRSVLFLGRGNLYPLALEGALKLKEISYIHAEGYAAGEMKHGPIALIEEAVPSVVLHPRDRHFDKIRSNLQEVKARGGPILAVVDAIDEDVVQQCDLVLPIPAVGEHLLPLLMSLPMQLIAYYVADHRGTDIDQPRNLAKAVTVE